MVVDDGLDSRNFMIETLGGSAVEEEVVVEKCARHGVTIGICPEGGSHKFPQRKVSLFTRSATQWWKRLPGSLSMLTCSVLSAPPGWIVQALNQLAGSERSQ